MKTIVFFKSPKINNDNQIDDSYYELFKKDGYNVDFIKVLRISNSYEGLDSFINNNQNNNQFGLIFTSSNSIKALESYILDYSNNIINNNKNNNNNNNNNIQNISNQLTDNKDNNQIIINFFNKYFNNKYIYIVGESSSKLFKSKFESIINNKIVRIESNATNLSKLILQDYNKEKNTSPLLYFCGNNRRDELPNFLKDNCIEFNEIIVYNSDIYGDSSNSIKDLYKRITNNFNNNNNNNNNNIWCSFFSPSGVEYVVDTINQLSNNDSNVFWNNIKVAAIGKTTENSLNQNNIKVDVVSPLPNAEQLFKSINNNITTQNVNK